MAAKKMKEAVQEEDEIRVSEHALVPPHELLTKEQKTELLKKFNITDQQLPKLLGTDPMVKEIAAKAGDVIKITRVSQTAGKTVYYRVVVGGSHAE